MLLFLTHRLLSLLSLPNIVKDEDYKHTRITSQAHIDPHNQLRSTSEIHPSLQERRDCLSLVEVADLLLLLTLGGEVYNTRSGKLLKTGITSFQLKDRELLTCSKEGYWFRSFITEGELDTDSQPIVSTGVDYLAVVRRYEPCYVVGGHGFIRWVGGIHYASMRGDVKRIQNIPMGQGLAVFESKLDIADPVRFCFITLDNNTSRSYYVQDYSIIHAEVNAQHQTIKLTVVNTFFEKIQSVQAIGGRYAVLLESGRVYTGSGFISLGCTTVAIGYSGRYLLSLTDSEKVKACTI
jgi:hypothetical protein